jgi:hypothetical protein
MKCKEDLKGHLVQTYLFIDMETEIPEERKKWLSRSAFATKYSRNGELFPAASLWLAGS